MPAIYASAPGKIILCGEHAVVYGQPAIALPVVQVQTKTTILAKPTSAGGQVRIIAPSIELDTLLEELQPDHPLSAAISLVNQSLGVKSMPACEILIKTTIPIAAGLGSSASVTVSLVRALSQFLGHLLPDDTVNKIAYEVEKIHHGTPSGIDNTVVTYQTPVFFRKDNPIERLIIQNGFTLLIVDSGTSSATVKTVSEVRARRDQDPDKYEQLFKQIGEITLQVYQSLCFGDLTTDGELLTQNHQLLQKIGVSTPLLDDLVRTALRAGAAGAKLSGGGGGGNMIALVSSDRIMPVSEALTAAGAKGIIVTGISSSRIGMK